MTDHDSANKIETLEWTGHAGGSLRLIDQTRLPTELVSIDCTDPQTVHAAIRQLQVRGAPAIGIAAAYGVVIGSQSPDLSAEGLPGDVFRTGCMEVCDYLATSRPTAVNLFWAIDRMRMAVDDAANLASPPERTEFLLAEARKIHEEDRQMCHAIGRHGAALIAGNLPSGERSVLTHCNAGGLATAEYGTALSVIFTMQDNGDPVSVFVDETRPLLQGARLTTWELQQRGIDTTLICDNMAAQVMREGKVGAVITGADRIAANGDAANKIGTYSLAVLASHHQIPFYVAAPSSTFDLSIETGADIPIEQRAASEITHSFGKQTAPDGVDVYNPAFDVTPAELITAIITERGIVQPVNRNSVLLTMGNLVV